MDGSISLQPVVTGMDKMNDILDYIDRHVEEYVEDLRRLLRQPSIAHTKEGIEETAGMTLNYLEEIGAKGELTRIGTGSPIIYAEMKREPAKKNLLVYGMYDVMPVTPKLWTSPPWEARIVDNKIVARGAVNSKGPLMAQIEAIKAMMAVAKKLPVNLTFVVEGEEDFGSPSIPEFVNRYGKKLKENDAFLMLLACPEKGEVLNVDLGLKGLLELDLEVRLREREVHGCYAPIIDNPVWRLIWALSSIKDAGDEILIKDFYDDVLPANADDQRIIEESAKTFDEEKTKELSGTEKTRKNLSGVELLRELLLRPTLNIDGVNSGYMGPGFKTIVPDSARAKVDIRLVPNMNADNVVNKVRRHLKKHGFEDVKVTKIAGYSWARTSAKEAIVQSSIRTAEKMGMQYSVLPSNPGSAPFYVFAKPPLNLPFVHLCTLTSILRMHKPDEYIAIEEYVNTIKYFATLLYEYSKS